MGQRGEALFNCDSSSVYFGASIYEIMRRTFSTPWHHLAVSNYSPWSSCLVHAPGSPGAQAGELALEETADRLNVPDNAMGCKCEYMRQLFPMKVHTIEYLRFHSASSMDTAGEGWERQPEICRKGAASP